MFHSGADLLCAFFDTRKTDTTWTTRFVFLSQDPQFSLIQTVFSWAFHSFSSVISLIDLMEMTSSHFGFGYILQTWGSFPPFQMTLDLLFLSAVVSALNFVLIA